MSASALSGLLGCERVQVGLDSYYNNHPVESTPILNAMFDPANNTRGISQLVNPGGGKKKTVRVRFNQRYLESEVSEVIDRSCSGGSPGQTYEDYEVDPDAGASLSETWALADLMDNCQSNEEFFNERLAVLTDAVRRKLERSMATQLALNVGNFATDDTVGVSGTLKTVHTLVTGTEQLSSSPLTQIAYTAQKSNFRNSPLVIGSGKIQVWFMEKMAACCNQYGMNLRDYAALYQAIFLPSNTIEAALGSDEFIVMDLGSVFPLEYNAYEGKSGFNTVGPEGVGTAQGTFIDPVSGILMDYKYVYNACDEEATILVAKSLQLAALPDSMFSGGDRLEGVNGIHNFKVVNS